MKAYVRAANLKRGLIVLAVLLAVGSLLYTNGLVDRLRTRESEGMEIWARAREEVARLPGAVADRDSIRQLAAQLPIENLSPESRRTLLDVLLAAERGTENPHSNFLFDVISNYYGDVPAVITDSLGVPLTWRNIDVDNTGPVSPADSARVRELVGRMQEVYPPIFIDGGPLFRQFVYYDESEIIRELRLYPLLQLFFVGLFILVGYLGFSYVRRSEQSSLWVGMAREAAHQLGTPLSSLMGWIEVLRRREKDLHNTAVEEIAQDVQRLSRVAHRFNDIGSLPKLDVCRLAQCVQGTAAYMRRRMPQRGISLEVDIPDDLEAPLNTQLFEWVVENLVKNALDALESGKGQIAIEGRREGGKVILDVSDTGRGIDRNQWENVFRPGYSTKKRGWGLGLSLAKRIVEDYHGGSLTVAQSRPGIGTTFRIELPTGAQRTKRRKR